MKITVDEKSAPRPKPEQQSIRGTEDANDRGRERKKTRIQLFMKLHG
jgi:hypothetical protein